MLRSNSNPDIPDYHRRKRPINLNTVAVDDMIVVIETERTPPVVVVQAGTRFTQSLHYPLHERLFSIPMTRPSKPRDFSNVSPISSIDTS